MLQFRSTGNLTRTSVTIDPPAYAERTLALQAMGHSEGVAAAIAAGDLAVRALAVDLARGVGLLIEVDTTAARAAGILQ